MSKVWTGLMTSNIRQDCEEQASLAPKALCDFLHLNHFLS